MSFQTLVVIVLAGLAGPLLALYPRHFVPVVVGEIVAGIVVGPGVLDAVDPTDLDRLTHRQPTESPQIPTQGDEDGQPTQVS